MEIVGQKRSLFRLGTLPSITCSFALTFTEKEALVRNQGLDSAFTRISFFFLLITGCVEGSETGHLDGNNSQCHFCNLLGSRVNWIHPKEYDLPQHLLCAHCHCWHDGVVQCSRQPFRLHPNEPSVQIKNQGSDLLPECFCSTQAKAAMENKGIETRL